MSKAQETYQITLAARKRIPTGKEEVCRKVKEDERNRKLEEQYNLIAHEVYEIVIEKCNLAANGGVLERLFCYELHTLINPAQEVINKMFADKGEKLSRVGKIVIGALSSEPNNYVVKIEKTADFYLEVIVSWDFDEKK